MRSKTQKRGVIIKLSICLIACWILQYNCSTCSGAILYPKASEEGLNTVRDRAGRILERHPPRGQTALRMQDLVVNDPYQQYVVGLEDLASGQLLSAAKFNSWHYILKQGTNVVGKAELRPDEKTGELKFAALYDPGPPLDALQEALKRAEKLPQIQKQDYEFRVLDIRPLYFHGVWLHSKSDDIILPLPSTWGRMNLYQPYSEAQTIKLLQPEARKALKAPGGTIN